MMDRKEIEHVFQWSDEYIKKNPEILNKSTNDIFEELDDGTKEMHHLRWGVMVLARMKNMTDFSYSGIIEYLSNFNEYSLMSEYIGFVLQTQYGIYMARLLIEGNNMGKDMFPYVSANILYDDALDINDIRPILNVFEANKDNHLLDCTIRNYANLIIKYKKEDYILKDYLSFPTEIYARLVLHIGRNLVYENIDQVDKMLSLLFEHDDPSCKFSALDLLELLSYGRTDFTDKYMEHCICLIKNDDYKLKLIGTFVNYLECGENGKHYHSIYEYLKEMIETSTEAKKILLHYTEYKKELDEKLEALIRFIIDNSFQKDKEILHSLDFYFSQKIKENTTNALNYLEKVYVINHYNIGDMFWNCIPLTNEELKSDQRLICKNCFKKILSGSIQEFSWGIELFETLVRISEAKSYFQNNMYNDDQMILILQGIIYFSVNAEKICEFLFLTIPYFESTDKVWDLICEDIYPNYAGNLMDTANKYMKNVNEKQMEISFKLLKMNKDHLDKIKRGYENKDLRPSAQREYEYQRFKIEQNKKLNNDSKQKSLFLKLFPERFMKYGTRIGFIQYGPNGKMTYHVSEYAKIGVSRELPRAFLNNPHDFEQKRKKYLICRCYNEADY